MTTHTINGDTINLADPLHRAAYSDHLEETGHADKAEMIRTGRFKVSRSNKTARAICEIIGFAGRRIKVNSKESGTPMALDSNYWDGGTNSDWHLATLEGDRIVSISKQPKGSPFRNWEGAKVIENGMLLVEWSTFCGKDCGITIYGTPETILRLFA